MNHVYLCDDCGTKLKKSDKIDALYCDKCDMAYTPDGQKWFCKEKKK